MGWTVMDVERAHFMPRQAVEEMIKGIILGGRRLTALYTASFARKKSASSSEIAGLTGIGITKKDLRAAKVTTKDLFDICADDEGKLCYHLISQRLWHPRLALVRSFLDATHTLRASIPLSFPGHSHIVRITLPSTHAYHAHSQAHAHAHAHLHGNGGGGEGLSDSGLSMSDDEFGSYEFFSEDGGGHGSGSAGGSYRRSTTSS